MDKIIFFILINLVFITLESSPIVIPIDSFQSKLEKGKEYENIIEELLESYIVSTIKIGSQLYPLKTFYNMDQYFHISYKCHIDESSPFDYKSNFNYNRHQSYSFSNTSSFNINFGKSSKACTAIENFELNDMEQKGIKLEKFDFILNKDTNEDETNCLQIGLLEDQYKETSFKGINLITQLKQKNVIKEYCWTMGFSMAKKYNNDYLLKDPDELINLKGNIIIGEFPHNYDSNNFYQSQYVKTYSEFSDTIMKWELKFKKVFYKQSEKNDIIIGDINVELDPSKYLIFAPKEYFDSITTNYFQKYIDKNICFNSGIEEFNIIYCEKSDKFSIKEIKTFPSIFLEHIELQYTFELSYKELFVEKNNNYWFLIVSDQYRTTGWKFGNIFMSKYQLVFNLDSKEIGFYNPKLSKLPNERESNISKSNGSPYFVLSIILIIILCLILVGVGIFIKMKFYPNVLKKKRANELDDDYEYISDKNTKNNNNNDNQLFNNNNIN